MRKKNIDLPAPIIPIGGGYYLVRPVTTDNVKTIEKEYNGERFLGKHRTIHLSDMYGMEYEKILCDYQDQSKQGKKVDSVYFEIYLKWSSKIHEVLSGYGKPWVQELRDDLKSVVIESGIQCLSTSVELLLQDLKQQKTVLQALTWAAHHAKRVPDGFV